VVLKIRSLVRKITSAFIKPYDILISGGRGGFTGGGMGRPPSPSHRKKNVKKR